MICIVIGLAAFVGRLTRGHPTLDACGKMLHVRVTEFLCRCRCGFVGHALRAATVGDDKRVLILRQEIRQLVLVGLEVDRACDMPLLP